MADLSGRLYIRGDYVIAGVKNAFNDKTSFWISKKGYIVSRYCFTADTEREVMYQLNFWDSYIAMWKLSIEAIDMKFEDDGAIPCSPSCDVCDFPCDNKTESGYCKSETCVNWNKPPASLFD